MGSEPDLRDGTQDLPPLRLFPDPLAGLVTGEQSADTLPAGQNIDDLSVPIPGPVEVDQASVQSMVDAVLNDEPIAKPRKPKKQKQGAARPFPPPAGKLPPGMLPPSQPSAAGQRMRQAVRAYPWPNRAANRGGPPRPAVVLKKPSKSMGAVVVAIILVLVFGAAAFELLAGIIRSVADLLD